MAKSVLSILELLQVVIGHTTEAMHDVGWPETVLSRDQESSSALFNARHHMTEAEMWLQRTLRDQGKLTPAGEDHD